MKSKVIVSSFFLPIMILMALVLFVYWPVLSRLINFLSSSDDFSYGLIVPIISAYILYLKWPQVKERNWQPSWWGLLIIVIGLWLYIAGELAADLYVPQIVFCYYA